MKSLQAVMALALVASSVMLAFEQDAEANNYDEYNYEESYLMSEGEALDYIHDELGVNAGDMSEAATTFSLSTISAALTSYISNPLAVAIGSAGAVITINQAMNDIEAGNFNQDLMTAIQNMADSEYVNAVRVTVSHTETRRTDNSLISSSTNRQVEPVMN